MVDAIAPPERPAEMDRTDEVGAAAAAEYFMRLFSYVMQTGDLTEWDRVSAQDCGFCRNVRSRVDEVYTGGGAFTGGELLLGPPAVIGYDDQIAVYAVEMPYEFAPGAKVDASGAIVEDIEAEDGKAVFDVIYSVAGWTMVGASVSAGEGR